MQNVNQPPSTPFSILLISSSILSISLLHSSTFLAAKATKSWRWVVAVPRRVSPFGDVKATEVGFGRVEEEEASGTGRGRVRD